MVPEGRQAGEGRGSREQVAAVLGEMVSAPDKTSEGDFHALAMLVVDAGLAGDEEALTAALNGLQRFYGAHLRSGGSSETVDVEYRGRVRGLIDCAYWARQRTLPRTSSGASSPRATPSGSWPRSPPDRGSPTRNSPPPSAPGSQRSAESAVAWSRPGWRGSERSAGATSGSSLPGG